MITTTFVCLCALVATSVCQYQKPSKDAAILSEARYLTANGQFGSAYTQEDGVEFKEESDGSGNRRGSYSYVDPTGKRRTVTYTAGKDGFKATGDHIPVPVAPPAVPAPSSAYPSPSQSQTHYEENGPAGASAVAGEDDGSWKDDTKLNYDDQPQSYTPQESYNPRVNPQESYNARINPQESYNPQQYGPVQFPYQSPSVPTYNDPIPSTVEPAHRFHSPGKINLNRSPDGFTYTFNKV